MTLFIVGLFCGLGALLRYSLRSLNVFCPIPLGTLAANLMVAFTIGYLSRPDLADQLIWLLLRFVLGGLGTYSTLNAELLHLLNRPKWLILYLLLTYVLGAYVAWLGLTLFL